MIKHFLLTKPTRFGFGTLFKHLLVKPFSAKPSQQDILTVIRSMNSDYRVNNKGDYEVKICRLCDKDRKSNEDNIWKLLIRSDGSHHCYRCANDTTNDARSKSFSGLKEKLKVVGLIPSNISTPSELNDESGYNEHAISALPRDAPKQIILPNQVESWQLHANLFQNSKLLSHIKSIAPSSNPALSSAATAVRSYLQDTRRLSLSITEAYGVGFGKQSFLTDSGVWEERTCVSFPWMIAEYSNESQSTISNIRINRIKYRALERKGLQRILPRDGAWGFFGFHLVKPEHESILITEGEYDAMAVAQAIATIPKDHHLYGLPAVSLPNGCNSLPVELIPDLERFKRIYLWMDADKQGQDSCKKFVAKLGSHRCWTIAPQSYGPFVKDANDALRYNSDVSNSEAQGRTDQMVASQENADSKPGNVDLVVSMIMSAKQPTHDRIETFSERKDEVVRAIREIALKGSSTSIRDGTQTPSIPALCAYTKGFRRGELTLLTGPTGGGKTTLLSQLSIDFAKQGAPTLWGSFEIKNPRLMHKMIQQFNTAGNLHLQSNLDSLEQVVGDFEALPLKFMNFHGSTDMEEVLEAMDFSVYRDDTQHIIIDNLQFMLPKSRGGLDKFELQDGVISALRKFATQKNVNVILVMHPRKEDLSVPLTMSSFYGSAKATQEADIVMIMQRKDVDDITWLQVHKNRYDGHLGAVPLKFSGVRCSYFETVPPKKPPLAPQRQYYSHQPKPQPPPQQQ